MNKNKTILPLRDKKLFLSFLIHLGLLLLKCFSMRLLYLAYFTLLFSTASAQKDSVIRLNAQSFEKRIQNDNIQLVDVRTEQEFRSGHIKNALLMNWNDEAQFNERVKYLEKDKPVYVYCLAGSRSLAAANWMKKNGFTNVLELEGGINSWKKADLPVEGSPSEKIISFKDFEASIPSNEITLVNIGSPGCPPCKKWNLYLTI